MASDKKKGGKGSKKADKALDKAQAIIKERASGLIDEVEKTGGILVNEVGDLFDGLAEKVAGVAGNAADATATVAEKVVVKELAHLVSGLIDDVRDAGEASLRAIGDGFDSLRGQLTSPTEETEEKNKNKNKNKSKKKEKVKNKEKIKPKDEAAESGVDVGTAQPGPAAPDEALKPKQATTKNASTAKKVVSKKAGGAKKILARKVGAKKAVVARKTVAKKRAAAKKTATTKTAAKTAAVTKKTVPVDKI